MNNIEEPRGKFSPTPNGGTLPSAVSDSPLFTGFLLSYLFTASSFALAGYLWGRDGFNLVLVGMGWPHVIFGFLFNLTKAGDAGRRYRTALTGLLMATVFIGWLSSFKPLAGIVFPYFIFHAFRDEIFIYRQRQSGFRFRGEVFDSNGIALLVGAVVAVFLGQIPARGAEGRLEVFLGECLSAAVLIALTYLAWPKKWTRVRMGCRYAAWALLLLTVVVTAMKALRMHDIISPSFLSFLVVFHYFSWYVFSLERIEAGSSLSAPPAETKLEWVMQLLRTRSGFVTAVVVLNTLSLAGAYVYNVMHLAPATKFAFELKYFMYVLIFHVTTSFAPKSSGKAMAGAAAAVAGGD